MPANQIACIAHMLSEERVVACLIPISKSILPGQRHAVLDQQKATGRSKVAACYDDIFSNYWQWQKEYVNPYKDGPFSEDLRSFHPSLAIWFKDGNEVKQLVTKVVNKVETILKNQLQAS
jgi:hypothetical protein